MPPTCCESDPATPAARHGSGGRSGWARLAIGGGVILVLWLAVLPRIADRPAVRRHIEFLEQQRVDPSAMFYTELDAMDEVRGRMAQLRSRHPASFWELPRASEPQPPNPGFCDSRHRARQPGTIGGAEH